MKSVLCKKGTVFTIHYIETDLCAFAVCSVPVHVYGENNLGSFGHKFVVANFHFVSNLQVLEGDFYQYLLERPMGDGIFYSYRWFLVNFKRGKWEPPTCTTFLQSVLPHIKSILCSCVLECKTLPRKCILKIPSL